MQIDVLLNNGRPHATLKGLTCTFRPQVLLYNRCRQHTLKRVLHQVEMPHSLDPISGVTCLINGVTYPMVLFVAYGIKRVLHSLTVKQVLTRNVLL